MSLCVVPRIFCYTKHNITLYGQRLYGLIVTKNCIYFYSVVVQNLSTGKHKSGFIQTRFWVIGSAFQLQTEKLLHLKDTITQS